MYDYDYYDEYYQTMEEKDPVAMSRMLKLLQPNREMNDGSEM